MEPRGAYGCHAAAVDWVALERETSLCRAMRLFTRDASIGDRLLVASLCTPHDTRDALGDAAAMVYQKIEDQKCFFNPIVGLVVNGV
ncbi:hypothetical protein CRG98_026014 [Punica granatum]|uniref:Uncharacterized protein n=1 Tax=Punica granatum TaxID=22663 RepID=A0A2I0JBG8_PUNGR|nr:hypothetical protein CRG98_026014 [Punica granatum]